MKRFTYAFAPVGLFVADNTRQADSGWCSGDRKENLGHHDARIAPGRSTGTSCPVYDLTAKFATYPLLLEWGENKDGAGSRR